MCHYYECLKAGRRGTRRGPHSYVHSLTPTYTVVPGLDFGTKMSVIMIKNDNNSNYEYELARGAGTLVEHLTRNLKI